jgi:hypothetical protein
MIYTTRYIVTTVSYPGGWNEQDAREIAAHTIMKGPRWLDHDPRLPPTPLVTAARSAVDQLRDIGGATPAGRLGMFQPLLLEIARSLESALKEDPSDAT